MTRKSGTQSIGPAQTQAQSNVDANKSGKGRSGAVQDGVKAKIRWLPPAMTEEEFVNILGNDWRVGKGKVGWFRYSPGHMPKGASKDPVPAWAQFQVKEEDVEELAQAVRNAVWEDAKGTFKDASLIGPPYVERAIYKKIPNTKSKKDPKEGTIDEDDEWQKFLVSLTQDPDGKKGEADAAADESAITEAASKPQVTPLVAHILESKANKAKEAANAKSRKHTRHDSQGKGKGAAATTDEPKKKSKEKADKPNATVRILKKQAATEAAAEAAKAVAKDIKAGAPAAETSSGRRRVGAISDILKRDLGLAGTSSRKSRQEARQEAAASKSADTEAKAKDGKGKANGATLAVASTSAKQTATPPTPTPTAAKGPVEKPAKGSRRRGGKDSKANESKAGGSSEAPTPASVKPLVILQKKKEDPEARSGQVPVAVKDVAPAAKSTNKSAASAAASAPPTGPKAGGPKGNQTGNSQKKANPPPTAAVSSTRAFLKHANPSQGVTEALLKEAMGAFGGVSSVEIDRRKGFAYVEFADHSGLIKALAASPVTVASAAVQVLERKDQAPKKAIATPAPSNAAQANTSKETKAPTSSSTTAAPPATPAVAAPPAEKANADQQPAKRSRRRGRGKGGNSGAAGNADNKSADQNGSSGGVQASSSAPAPAPVTTEAASTG
ncbi:unnamed protein product [Discula destructiva]